MTTSPYFPVPDAPLSRRPINESGSRPCRPARRIALDVRRRADRHLGG